MLHAGLGPLGAMRITLRLHDTADGCRVEMIEVPASGLLDLVPDRLVLLGVAPRNRECLWRLAAMAERLEPNKYREEGHHL